MLIMRYNNKFEHLNGQNTNNIANLYINGNKVAADTHAIHRPVNPNVTIGRHTTAILTLTTMNKS